MCCRPCVLHTAPGWAGPGWRTDARGQFTYWSLRTFARPVNKGLRLDYFLCSRDMFPAGCNERDDGAAVMDADSSNSGKGTQSNNDEEQDLVSSTAMLNSSTVVAEKEAEAGAGAGAGALTPLTALRRADFNEGSVPAPGAYDCFILHKEAFGCSDHCPLCSLSRWIEPHSFCIPVSGGFVKMDGAT